MCPSPNPYPPTTLNPQAHPHPRSEAAACPEHTHTHHEMTANPPLEGTPSRDQGCAATAVKQRRAPCTPVPRQTPPRRSPRSAAEVVQRKLVAGQRANRYGGTTMRQQGKREQWADLRAATAGAPATGRSGCCAVRLSRSPRAAPMAFTTGFGHYSKPASRESAPEWRSKAEQCPAGAEWGCHADRGIDRSAQRCDEDKSQFCAHKRNSSCWPKCSSLERLCFSDPTKPRIP